MRETIISKNIHCQPTHQS